MSATQDPSPAQSTERLSVPMPYPLPSHWPWPWPGPTGPTFPWSQVAAPPLPTESGSRLLGLSAGDMHGKLLREMLRHHEAASGDPARIMADGLLRLQSKDLIRQRDVEHLNRVVNAVSSKNSPEEMLLLVRNAHTLLLDDETASPLALAIASIAVDSSLTAMDKKKKVDVGADVGGAIAGAIFGGWLGAFLGAAVASYIASR